MTYRITVLMHTWTYVIDLYINGKRYRSEQEYATHGAAVRAARKTGAVEAPEE